VVLTAESVIPVANDGTPQLIYYDEGIGTRWFDKWIGGLFGAGLLNNLTEAYRFLIFNYRPGDEIYVFGFSRGAYSARSFVGLLRHSAIVNRRIASKIKEAISNYKCAETDPGKLEDIRRRFRSSCSFDVCVSEEDEDWLANNVQDYRRGDRPRLRIKYLGVWDTVGALGIPGFIFKSPLLYQWYQFHDTSLSGEFVESARHAVAIDERRASFAPTLWDNIEQLNTSVGMHVEDGNAPYQQKWFPGTHGSVGGGGDRRGLSDQAMSWVLDGARNAGLQLDTKEGSRIYELTPNHTENLFNVSKPTWWERFKWWILPKADRLPGPQYLWEINKSARRRWWETPETLRSKSRYRPNTLNRVATELDALDAGQLGVGPNAPQLPKGSFNLHVVKPHESLRGLAKQYYDDPNQSDRIYKANLDTIDDPNRIFAGQSLRIPKEAMTLPYDHV
jgi:uncharacterized protein (DUF2235 family)